MLLRDPRTTIGGFFCWGGAGYDDAIVAKLFNLVVVADDDKNEDKSQWDNDPQRIDTVRLRDGCTSFHLYLQDEGGRTFASSTGLYEQNLLLDKRQLPLSRETCMRKTKRLKHWMRGVDAMVETRHGCLMTCGGGGS